MGREAGGEPRETNHGQSNAVATPHPPDHDFGAISAYFFLSGSCDTTPRVILARSMFMVPRAITINSFSPETSCSEIIHSDWWSRRENLSIKTSRPGCPLAASTSRPVVSICVMTHDCGPWVSRRVASSFYSRKSTRRRQFSATRRSTCGQGFYWSSTSFSALSWSLLKCRTVLFSFPFTSHSEARINPTQEEVKQKLAIHFIQRGKATEMRAVGHSVNVSDLSVSEMIAR